MLRFACLTLSLLAVSAAAGAQTTDCTEITAVSYTITAPGVYCLKSSLTATTGGAIAIAASDVTVDLNGHTLTLQATYGGIYTINAERENVTVRNGIIRGGGEAVRLAGPGHVVERIRVVNAAFAGITVHGTGGVVRNNSVVGTGGPLCCNTGIAVSGTGLRVSDNQVLETGLTTTGEANGIRVGYAPGAVIERNLIANATPAAAGDYPMGIHIFVRSGPDARMTVAGNRIVNMRNGIFTATPNLPVLYLDNAVSASDRPFFGGIVAGDTNFSF